MFDDEETTELLVAIMNGREQIDEMLESWSEALEQCEGNNEVLITALITAFAESEFSPWEHAASFVLAVDMLREERQRNGNH